MGGQPLDRARGVRPAAHRRQLRPRHQPLPSLWLWRCGVTFAFAPAVRDRVGLLIGLAGPTGSGKTLSALKIGRGLAGGDDSKIAFVDTEGGRGKHYAPAPGEKPSETVFGFQHCDLRPPFTPEAYRDTIAAADAAGFEVILVDSFSHVWDGDGGLQEMHDVIVDESVVKSRAAAEEKGWRFDEAVTRDKASIGAWKEPKTRHKRLVSRLLQCRAHLVICMRADEKMRMETVEEEGRNGKNFKKTVITAAKDLPLAERWVPIVEKRFPYELTTSFVLAPTNPGVPIPIKLQDQHRAAVPLDRRIDESVGRALATWAKGGAAPMTARERLYVAAREAADRGAVALADFRRGLDARADTALFPILDELTRRASDFDAANDSFPGDRSEAA
ncbi:AAA family ATPase [Methylobacterium sp. Leaf466]|uniref:AAA family ATPase n=1 Tax=Methylobacterium sp. Leaf466 TaxID=1736386 RepID=UPI0009E6B889|nr:AAA family ATPase [Methylobacterium sp. Leaf466]